MIILFNYNSLSQMSTKSYKTRCKALKLQNCVKIYSSGKYFSTFPLELKYLKFVKIIFTFEIFTKNIEINLRFFFFQIGSSTLIHATFIDSKVFFIMINVCLIHFLIKSVNLTSHWWRFIQFIINLQYSIFHWGIFVCFHLFDALM